MNEETTVPFTAPSETFPETTIAETTIATTAATDPAPTEAVQETTVPDYYIPETQESVYIETYAEVIETTEPVYIEVIESASNDIAHASLFGSFLICGTLVGLSLLRGFHGS